METREYWNTQIGESGGKVMATVTLERLLKIQDMIDAGWFYYNPEDGIKKMSRDKIARAMRKDGWAVKTETNSLGWFIECVRPVQP